MPSSPTPSEREKADAELKVKEAAEQATLPYTWSQTIQDLDISAPVGDNLKGRDLQVEIKKTTLMVRIKGEDPIIDVNPTNYSALLSLYINAFYNQSLRHLDKNDNFG